ncbi:MAG: bifunctional alpha,alpha-trehalose-phosphate synthase (UDP-forming)/trehalose-phosphatase [Bacteroidales bacterium]|nr:bifunctional alpha,alpha-trehalose-phosphate synthase (UDP-forming)/trehalose-phosphatase [Bacteroidales bacterium]MCF8396843.1 bifunctional alpha,alpha-trehalose-phosphate synthase (UDP-forming)/trehalose-phosphatase [Bacteroidales bacterium]
MRRLIIVSNRLPVSIVKKRGEIKVNPSVGGLATGMKTFYKTHDSLWFGWPGINQNQISVKDKAVVEEKLLYEKCKPVYLTKHDLNQYYYGFSNKTLWPLFHYFPQYTEYREDMWQSYEKVNKIFAKALLKEIREDDIVWIHDYHLFLLPQLIREKFPQISIGFFLHIPFPSYEVFRLLPWRIQILEGILGADLIGFHTYDYQRHFLSATRRLLGYDAHLNQISVEHRDVKIDAFPMGIDYDRFHDMAMQVSKNSEKRRSRIKKTVMDATGKQSERKLILSMDRLDYSKGIPARLQAFERFLERNKRYHEKVSMFLLAVPSRTNVDQYRELKSTVDEMVGRINGNFGTIDWMPIRYFYRSLPFDQIVELYVHSDIALVTPLRDGMNLIAKEFLVSKTDSQGVLILSEMAGSVKELGEAIIVNPNDINNMAESIEEALRISKERQIKGNEIMRKRLRRYDVTRWANEFMKTLTETKELQQKMLSKKMNDNIIEEMANAYKKAKNRLILLDYDGTMIPFNREYYKSKPDKEIMNILENLSKDEKTCTVVISGRDKDTLEDWFGKLPLCKIAEHGVWIKDKTGKWEMIEPLSNAWKDEIRTVLERFVDRTPGSAIEEKNYSLVWHYRKADQGMGLIRAREMKDELTTLLANLNVEILEGNKVIEIKSIGVNKGRAVRSKLPDESLDFIMAIGDDWSDEFLYEVLPDSAYTINVGFRTTQAKYCINNVKSTRNILKKLANIN